MPRFAIRTPYLVLVAALALCLLGANSLLRMPVDMFPSMNIPVVVVATFFSGMPPEQIETDITSRFERFFTLASGVEHIESRSLPGVSVIRVYFQPGSNPDSAVTNIGNLAMANLRRLPPGTLPPLVLKFDASSLPVCLVTLKGDGLTETALRDLAQYQVRNQIASVPGASVPQPFGGALRQIMVYADPYRLEAHQLSLMDLVRQINLSNLILPAGDVQIGNRDYSIYTNSQLRSLDDINQLPVKIDGQTPVRLIDVATAKDAQQIQTNIVRVDGQRSVYIPVLKQGGDTNTIAVVDGMRDALNHLSGLPPQLSTRVVFDQSAFVKTAIETLLHEGALGLILTSLMILLFLGSLRATTAVLFSIPLSALATFLCLALGGGTVNSMVLGGLALVFSRLIDNSVVVLENIYRHLENGLSPREAAETGGSEVALPVLASTLTTAVVFFPVTLLYGVSRYLFSALALAVVLALAASYFVALSVVPLYSALYLRHHAGAQNRLLRAFNAAFEHLLRLYDHAVLRVLRAPRRVLLAALALFVLSFALWPFLGMAFFPRTDAGQFVVNLKLPSGTRLAATEQRVARIEALVREIIPAEDLALVVSNLGINSDFSAVYTPNSGPHTAFLQVSLAPEHRTGSYEYMERLRRRLHDEMPDVTAFFQSGGLVDAVLNLGLPAPIDLQLSGSDLDLNFHHASDLAAQIRRLPGVAEAFIPQDLDSPALQLDVDRLRAAQLGLTQHEVVSNLITALTSNAMIAPTFWIDPRTGNDYLLTVQYPEAQIRQLADLDAIALRGANRPRPTRLENIATTRQLLSPTEVDHYQLRRVIDIYVRPLNEDLGRVAAQIDGLLAASNLPKGVQADLRGMVQGLRASFKSFALGLLLALVLLYLILVAQFRGFLDPLLILLAIPPALTGVLLTLVLTGTTLNVMSLMGVVMLVGIAVSNSILIVEFTAQLRARGCSPAEAVSVACRVRLRPVLMTSLATLIGLLPMALKLGAGSESYAPLARAILGGLTVSVLATIFLVPAAYVLVHREKPAPEAPLA